MKPIEFRGDSLDCLREFPKPARREAGFQLDRVQRGLEPFDWKPMTAVGAGVREIRIRDESGSVPRALRREARGCSVRPSLLPEEDASHVEAGRRSWNEKISRVAEGAEMTRKRFSSVWDAIEDSATEAASMKLRAELANEIIERMHARKLTQSKAAELIGVTQPRISDLMRGRLNLFSLDALVDMADRIGLRTRMVVSPKRAA